jgi:hypothetical protein
MTCRNCKLYDLDATKDKAGRVRKDRIAECLWTNKRRFPVSLIAHPDWTLGPMRPDDGASCPCFVERIP